MIHYIVFFKAPYEVARIDSFDNIEAWGRAIEEATVLMFEQSVEVRGWATFGVHREGK